MKYEWKKGDKLRLVDNNHYSLETYSIGTIFTADNDVSTDSGEWAGVKVLNPNGKLIAEYDYHPNRFEKVDEETKSKPLDLHLVLVDSCKNFVGVRNSYKEAVELAKERSDAVTIYKLQEVANVTTERRVKVIKPKKLRKTKSKKK